MATQKPIIHAKYFIGVKNLAGGVSLTADLVIHLDDNSVTGYSQVTQATHPMLDVKSRISGEFSRVDIKDENIVIITATGYPYFNWPPGFGPGPAVQPNLRLKMILDKSAQVGVATFSYLDNRSEVYKWETQKDVPVHLEKVAQQIEQEEAVNQA